MAAGKIIKRSVKAAFSKRPFSSVVCWHVARSRPAVALSFDDGPTAEHTPRVLAILKEYKVPATFFVLGMQMDRNPGATDALFASGHEIGNHGINHEKHDQKELRSQVLRCDEMLAARGVRSRLYRPPGGELHAGTVFWLWRHGFTTVLWSFDDLDSMRLEGKWHGADPDYAAIRNGDIILMHDDNPLSVRDLPVLLEAVLKAGLQIVPVSSLIRGRGYAGSQRNCEPAQ